MERRRALRIATRGSPLALAQAERVAGRIGSAGGPACETVVVHSRGDRVPDLPIERIGGQGAFVKDVSAALLDARADIAVHSAKDLTSSLEPGLCLAAVPERADPRDALVGSQLDRLPPGSVVATGSVRRRAQLAWVRPDLTFCDLRGNMHRRVERSELVGAGVVALCALERLGLLDRVAEVLEPSEVLPQVGQGAIAVECRSSDREVLELLENIDDLEAHTELLAERAFLGALGGGCSLPCGALARASASSAQARHALVVEGMLASRDGHVLVRRVVRGEDPDALGAQLAADLLDSAGGRWLEDWAVP